MLRLLLVVTALELCSALNILVVFPFPSKSHSILGDGVVRHLLGAGHDVTYITPYSYKNPPPNLRQIDVAGNEDAMSVARKFMSIESFISVAPIELYITKNAMLSVVNATVTNPNVRKLMESTNERFDAVIVEWMFSEVYAGFSMVFGCPLIWVSPLDPHIYTFHLLHESPNPAYTADPNIADHPPFTFVQRVQNLWRKLKDEFVMRPLENKQITIYNEGFGPVVEKRGLTFVPINEMKYNGSLMLGNSHAAFDQGLPHPQNYKPILGYHIPEEVTPLPENLKKIMDSAKNGVIFFSMGSVLSGSSFPAAMQQELLEVFRALPQTIIWKFEKELPNAPENVHVVSWAPQNGVLAHPNCVLFITHGGLLSMTEAIHFAVPIVGVPAFGDQFLNVDRAVRKGFARRVYLDHNFAKNLNAAIKDVIGNPSYRSNMKTVSYIFHHRPSPPGAELVHWVEHVVATGGAPHLRSPALHLPIYQRYYLDLLALLAAGAYVIFRVYKRICVRSNVGNKKYD